jgi:hypothetical protein
MRVSIYVYLLKDGKLLISSCEDKDACSFLYQEIVKNNPIVDIYATVGHDISGWEFESYVLKYMQKMGIDNVRGGRFNKLVLSESTKNEISDSIKYFVDGQEEEEARVQKYYTYKSSLLSPDVYRENINKYNTIEEKRKKYEIDRNITYELNWLLKIIENNNTHFFDIITKYDNLMKNLAKVYNQYLNVVENAENHIIEIHNTYDNCVKCNLFFEKPYVFFDQYVIENERLKKSKILNLKKHLECVVKIFELAIYNLINREDELIFELNQIDLKENIDKLYLCEQQNIKYNN